jgi:hypothetical protein
MTRNSRVTKAAARGGSLLAWVADIVKRVPNLQAGPWRYRCRSRMLINEVPAAVP